MATIDKYIYDRLFFLNSNCPLFVLKGCNVKLITEIYDRLVSNEENYGR